MHMRPWFVVLLSILVSTADTPRNREILALLLTWKLFQKSVRDHSLTLVKVGCSKLLAFHGNDNMSLSTRVRIAVSGPFRGKWSSSLV